jgi:xanthine dehydrogenase YagR molybdenum-binding subunit
VIGTGVAASTYPVYRRLSQATAEVHPDGRFTVRIAAADIGTGARTVLTQIAADTLRTSPDRVRVEIGDSALPTASLAGGSMGTALWGTAVVRACEALVDGLDRRDGDLPAAGMESSADTAASPPRSGPAFTENLYQSLA